MCTFFAVCVFPVFLVQVFVREHSLAGFWFVNIIIIASWIVLLVKRGGSLVVRSLLLFQGLLFLLIFVDLVDQKIVLAAMASAGLAAYLWAGFFAVKNWDVPFVKLYLQGILSLTIGAMACMGLVLIRLLEIMDAAYRRAG